VKLLNGIVNSPVTQVADVAVNKRSIKGIGIMRDIGKDNNKVPVIIRIKNEKRIIREGEISIVVFFIIDIPNLSIEIRIV
jgi:hypothetical protein